ncbi:MAG: hypothetical protein Tsb0033_21150 [Winogradskyella sp.]
MNFESFKTEFKGIMSFYRVKHTFFENGEFGDLNRIEFEYLEKCGTIDFWELGWVEIHIINYDDEKEIFHILLEPNQEIEMERAFEILKNILMR